MENKRTRRTIQRNHKNYLSSIEKIIKYQEKIFNLTYKQGKWIERRKNGKKNTKKETSTS